MSIEELREQLRRVWNENSGHGERMTFIEALVEHDDREVKTVLREPLLNDPSAFVRRNAATAFPQVWYRIARAKCSAIEILGEGLKVEEDREAACSIVVSLQDIMKRRFGSRGTSLGSWGMRARRRSGRGGGREQESSGT